MPLRLPLFGNRNQSKLSGPRQPFFIRFFDAAKTDNHTFNWMVENTSIHKALDHRLGILRARCQDGERNNAILRRYFNILTQNVVGGDGFNLQNRAIDRYDENGQPVYDKQANDAIEAAWKDFCKPENFSIGKKSAAAFQQLGLRRTACDGEAFITHHYSSDYKYGYKPRLVNADSLDYTYHDTKKGIIFGTQINELYEAQYHYFRKFDLHDDLHGTLFAPHKRIAVDANEINHLYFTDYAEQTRGYPWASSIMLLIEMLKSYEKAELVAATNASKLLGFFKKVFGAGGPTPESDPKLAKGNWTIDVKDGEFMGLPEGYDFVANQMSHPLTQYGDYTKTLERRISIGLNITYALLFSNLKDVNFSSARIGSNEDLEYFILLQNWMIEHFVKPIYERWLRASLDLGAIKLPSGRPLPSDRFDKFNAPRFIGRRWKYMDPLKETNSDIARVNARLISRKRLMAERGIDYEEELAQIEQEEKDLIERGIPSKDTPLLTLVDAQPKDNDE